MTMPDPVAEVVELLRSIGGPTREEAADQLADLLERQQAEIERLSRERDTVIEECAKEADAFADQAAREGWTGPGIAHRAAKAVANALRAMIGKPRGRDTGVPEGFWLAPNELDDAMIEACAGAFFAAFDKRVSGSRPFHRWYEAIRAAAPQPPTVSPDIVALTRERDQARADVNEWLDEIENFGLRRERLPEGALPWVEAAWRLGAQTVVRERDQAREALAWYGEQARLARLIHSEGDEGRHALAADGGKRARSVLHPEKEEKA